MHRRSGILTEAIISQQILVILLILATGILITAIMRERKSRQTAYAWALAQEILQETDWGQKPEAKSVERAGVLYTAKTAWTPISPGYPPERSQLLRVEVAWKDGDVTFATVKRPQLGQPQP